MASSGKPTIGIFVNKQVPWTDYRIGTALALRETATFEFVFPGDCTSRIASQFRCHRVDFGEGVHFSNDLKGLIQLWRVLRSCRFDIAHFFSTKYILLGPLIARIAGVKRVIFTVTGLGRTFSSESRVLRQLRHLYLALFRISLRVSRSVLFQNSDDFHVFAALFPWGVTRFTIIGSSMTLESATARGEQASVLLLGPRKSGELRLAMVARLFEDKGIREFLDVARRVKQTHGDRAKFILVGPPSAGQDELHREVQTAHQEGEVLYLGERADVVSLLRECDIFVFCSYREGIPRALLEAHGCGLPSVAFDVPGCRDVLLDGVTGFLTPARDVATMSEKIGELIRDPRLRETFGGAARRRFLDEYSIERFARRMAAVYGLEPAQEPREQALSHVAQETP